MFLHNNNNILNLNVFLLKEDINFFSYKRPSNSTKPLVLDIKWSNICKEDLVISKLTWKALYLNVKFFLVTLFWIYYVKWLSLNSVSIYHLLKLLD